MGDVSALLPGHMVVVVGPSGVGKDTVMSYAAERLAGHPNVEFVRRIITRAADAGGEAHLSVSPERFEELVHSRALAVHWHAHGQGYGLPATTYAGLTAGKVMVANGSRAALDRFAERFDKLIVVRITASRDCLLARLLARGREDKADILSRLDRTEPPMPPGLIVRDIDNSGPVATAGEALLQTILELTT